MSEKIVQFNEEIIKGQIKELVRGSVEETLNELHACSKKFEFYCLTSRERKTLDFSFYWFLFSKKRLICSVNSTAAL